MIKGKRRRRRQQRGVRPPQPWIGQTASLAISLEEVVPLAKKRKTGDKGKEKVSSNAWANDGATMARANDFLILKEMREISSIPSHEIVSQPFVVHLVVMFWERRCILLLSIWQMRRRLSWPTQRLRYGRPRLQGCERT